jgi:hypothetical protein
MRHHPRLRSTTLVWLTLLGLPALRADVTLRYKTQVDINPNLPQQITQQAMKTLDASLPPSETRQFKNGKMFSSGSQAAIIDFTKREITLLDPAGKRYATVPADRYGDEIARAMPEMPAEAKAGMAAMKGHAESKATGRTATIQGVECDEREIVMTVDLPPMPNVLAGPMMRMVMHIWTAKASEAARVPAIGELAGYNLFSIAGMDPVTSMAKTFQQIQGFGDTMATLMKELQSGGTSVFLRMQMEMYMPMLAALLKQMPNSPAGAGFDADAPLVHVNQELAEISTAPVPDSVFRVPEGYQSVPAADLLKDLIKQKMAQAQPAK